MILGGKNKYHGYSLVELMVSVAIIATVGVGAMQFLGINAKTSKQAKIRSAATFNVGYLSSLLRNRFALALSASGTSASDCLTLTPTGVCRASSQFSIPIKDPGDSNKIVIGTANNPVKYNINGFLCDENVEECFIGAYANLIALCIDGTSCPGADAVAGELHIVPLYPNDDLINFKPHVYETYLNLRTRCWEQNVTQTCPDTSNQVITGFSWDCKPICKNVPSTTGSSGLDGAGAPLTQVHDVGCPP